MQRIHFLTIVDDETVAGIRTISDGMAVKGEHVSAEAPPADLQDVVVNPVRLAVFLCGGRAWRVCAGRGGPLVNPPALSMHFRALERVWGSPLFDRKHRDGVVTDEPFVVGGTGDTAGDRALDAALARAGLPPRRIVMRAGLQEGAKHAILAAAGLTVLSHWVVAASPANEPLVSLPLEGPPLEDPFFLIY